mmetsp:Transcript_31594/g.76326  ORF Transcript_31594/g.76326 Transcript_31594/m.76326 type:complete len:349 (-) Transcript_31594:129-1175(-)
MYRVIEETKASSEFGLALQQAHEILDIESGKQLLDDINPRVVDAAELNVHRGATEFKSPENVQEHGQNKKEEEIRPCIKTSDLVPSEVKRRTGFQDLPNLLSYAMVVCDGDLERLFATSSKLTWLEEWLFFFEFKYGRTAGRWKDYAHMYKCREKTLRRILKKRLSQELEIRKRWPMYATYEEDAKFRDEKWDFYFKNGERIVMHDATGLPWQCPSNAALQRALWSDYYGTTCAKGGISNQLCGWIRGMPLFTGRITDSQMIKDSEIMVAQRKFSEADASSDKSFANVLDKGFRNTVDAAAQGQTCLQPKYSKGHCQFTGRLLYTQLVLLRYGLETNVRFNAARCRGS